MTWKSKNGEKPEDNINQIDVLLNGVFRKDRLIDIISNFILFQNKEKGRIKRIRCEYVSSGSGAH